MASIDTTTYEKIDTLEELADLFYEEDIFGHKLVYFHEHEPFDFFSVEDGESYDVGDFSPSASLGNLNDTLFKTMFYKDMYAFQGNNFFLGFDNGKYLYVDCWGDSLLTLWVTEDPNDHGPCGNSFRLDRFFDDYMGSTLVDVDFLPFYEYEDGYDGGGKIFECGDYVFYGRLELFFDNGKSLVFTSIDGMPRITSYIGDEIDVCNYWHVASCYNLRQMWMWTAGRNTADVREYLTSSFDKEFVDSVMEKVDSFNFYQLQNVWSELCLHPHVARSKDDVIRLINYYIDYPAEDSRDLEIMENYAKYICDIFDRRDVLDEDYILSRLGSIDKMQMLLDRMTVRMPSLQCEDVMEDIDNISKEADNEQ